MESWHETALRIRTRAERSTVALPRFVRGLRYGSRLRASAPAVNGAGPAAASAENPLTAYFDAHDTGPGIWKWRHYFDIYHRHFAKFVGTEVRVVEVGVYSGGSLDMWLEYFGPRCTIYGVDVEPACRGYERDSVQIFIGDQADSAFWQRFRSQVPPVDVVIDDGGHEPEQQIVTLECLLPHVRPGGVYLCEDIKGVGNPFHAYLAGLSQNLHGGRSSNGVVKTTGFQQLVDSVHVYPWVTVIERSGTPRTELVVQRHGTQWQPW